MTPGTIQTLFERIFGDADGSSKDNRHAVQAAHLSAEVNHDGAVHQGELSDKPSESTALIAAFLDGGLDSTMRQEIHARLAKSGSALADLASADSFVEAVRESQATAPGDLVMTIVNQNQTVKTISKTSRNSLPIWKWSGIVIFAAAVAIFIAIVFNAPPVPTNPNIPQNAKIIPKTEGTRVVAPQPSNKALESEVTKKADPQRSNMLPAGSLEMMPGNPERDVNKQ